MSKDVTRIEISRNLHQTLKNEKQRLREKTGKNITLQRLFEKLCEAGLEYGQMTAGETDSDGKMPGFTRGHHEYVIEPKSELKAMQEALYEKEKRLTDIDTMLMAKQDTILSWYSDYFKKMEELNQTSGQEQASKKQLSSLEQKNKEQKETIEALKAKNSRLEDEVLKLLIKIEGQTQKDTLKDEILPVLNPILLGLILNGQNTQQKNQNADFAAVFDKLSEIMPEDQKQGFKKVKSIFENTKVTVKNQDEEQAKPQQPPSSG